MQKENDKQYVHLVRYFFNHFSMDDCHFYIQKEVAEQSAFIKRKVSEDSNNPIIITNVKGEILEIVVDYLNHKVFKINSLVLLGSS